MGIEIERKFLINPTLLPDVNSDLCKPYVIVQAYLSLKSPCVRVRVIDSKEAYITIKGTGLVSRKEFEYSLPIDDANKIIRMSTNIIYKTRRRIKFDNNVWEVDHFGGPLYIAEIELEKEDQKFSKPPWVLKEVSEDMRYTNVYISQFGFPKEI